MYTMGAEFQFTIAYDSVKLIECFEILDELKLYCFINMSLLFFFNMQTIKILCAWKKIILISLASGSLIKNNL